MVASAPHFFSYVHSGRKAHVSSRDKGFLGVVDLAMNRILRIHNCPSNADLNTSRKAGSKSNQQHRGLLTVPLPKDIQLEVEYDARLVLETVLTAAGGVVEASVKIVYLGRPECDCTRMVDRNVNTSARRERKGIAGGSLGEHHAC